MSTRLRHALFIAVCAVSLIVLATFNGILTADTRLAGAVLVGILGVGGLALAWIRPAGAEHTPLDAAIAVWWLAFAFTTLANAEAWRQMSIGLWFAALYTAIWLLLCALLARRWLTRAALVDALLIVGAVGLFIGAAQWRTGAGFPVSFLGNTNAFALMLVLLIPLAAQRALTGRMPIARVVMTVYALAALALLLATGSRGGWLGGLSALAAWLAYTGWAHRHTLAAMWRARARLTRRAIAGAGIIALAAALAIGGVAFARTFSTPGRTLDFRTWIYATAIDTFTAHPLTGTGLFTFGTSLMQARSTPNAQPHSHAHSLILNVAAELGVTGLAALLLTALLGGRALWRAARQPETGGLHAAGGAALIGLGVHTLFDLPLMMPALALMALVVTVIAIAPDGAPTDARPRGLRRFAAPLLLIALSGFALRDALTYREAIAHLSRAVTTRAYADGAAALAPLADADPALPVLHTQRGMLLALAGDHADAAAAYARAIDALPYDGAAWLNLAALHLAAGDPDAARAASARGRAIAADLEGRLVVIESAADALARQPDEARARFSAAMRDHGLAAGAAPDATAPDFVYGVNLPYNQYLHLAIPRIFVPQTDEGAIAAALAAASAP
jgi:O-antigen ligase